MNNSAKLKDQKQLELEPGSNPNQIWKKAGILLGVSLNLNAYMLLLFQQNVSQLITDSFQNLLQKAAAPTIDIIFEIIQYIFIYGFLLYALFRFHQVIIQERYQQLRKAILMVIGSFLLAGLQYYIDDYIQLVLSFPKSILILILQWGTKLTTFKSGFILMVLIVLVHIVFFGQSVLHGLVSKVTTAKNSNIDNFWFGMFTGMGLAIAIQVMMFLLF